MLTIRIMQALSLAQWALSETDADLHRVQKELFTLMASLPLKKRKGMLDKSDSVNESVSRAAKKFNMLYCLWVIQGLFPITNNPCVDLSTTAHWASPEARHDAIITELFMIMPEALSKEIHT